MATNQVIDGRWHINVPVPAAVTVGMPVLVGKLAGVVLALQPIPTPLSPTSATVDTGEDCYALSVVAQTVASPQTGSAVQPGDIIYAVGTLDSTTNVTYNLTLDKASGGTQFGHALSAVTSGATALTNVRLGAK